MILKLETTFSNHFPVSKAIILFEKNYCITCGTVSWENKPLSLILGIFLELRSLNQAPHYIIMHPRSCEMNMEDAFSELLEPPNLQELFEIFNLNDNVNHQLTYRLYF